MRKVLKSKHIAFHETVNGQYEERHPISYEIDVSHANINLLITNSYMKLAGIGTDLISNKTQRNNLYYYPGYAYEAYIPTVNARCRDNIKINARHRKLEIKWFYMNSNQERVYGKNGYSVFTLSRR